MAITIFFATQPVSVSVPCFVCDAVISTSPSFDNKITSHKTDSGSNISDHSYNQNPTISVSGVISSEFIGALAFESNVVGYESDRVEQAHKALKELWRTGEPFAIVDEYDVYNNCVLKTYSATFDKNTGDSLQFTMTAEQIRIAEAEVVDVRQLDASIQDDAEKNKKGNSNKISVEDSFRLPGSISELLEGLGSIFTTEIEEGEET